MYLEPDQPLGAFLPQLRTIVEPSNPTGLILDKYGNALPPCIVMEKGEALDIWAKSTGDGLDMITGLQVLLSAMMDTQVPLYLQQYMLPIS